MSRNKTKEIGVALYKKLAPLLPVVTPSAKGGRPGLSDQQALNGIVFVLRTGRAAARDGLWQRHDVLEAAARLASGRGMARS